MMLVEQTQVPDDVLPVEAFKKHLRLGTGFAEDDLQDTLLEAHLRAALATIEGRIAKAIFVRQFDWTVAAWRNLDVQNLPIAPVASIDRLTIMDRLDQAEVIAPSRYRMTPDVHRPRLVAAGFYLPTIPVGGRAVVTFTAGMASDWAQVPHDLSQAVLLLASELYEDRRGRDGQIDRLPQTVELLLQRYRDVRLFRGGWS